LDYYTPIRVEHSTKKYQKKVLTRPNLGSKVQSYRNEKRLNQERIMRKFEVKVFVGKAVATFRGMYADSVAAVDAALVIFGFSRDIRIVAVEVSE
jgi:uncharacterized membrane protein YbaN (DUF454 family)